MANEQFVQTVLHKRRDQSINQSINQSDNEVLLIDQSINQSINDRECRVSSYCFSDRFVETFLDLAKDSRIPRSELFQAALDKIAAQGTPLHSVKDMDKDYRKPGDPVYTHEETPFQPTLPRERKKKWLFHAFAICLIVWFCIVLCFKYVLPRKQQLIPFGMTACSEKWSSGADFSVRHGALLHKRVTPNGNDCNFRIFFPRFSTWISARKKISRKSNTRGEKVTSLDDADLICHVKRIVVGKESDIGFLESVRPAKKKKPKLKTAKIKTNIQIKGGISTNQINQSINRLNLIEQKMQSINQSIDWTSLNRKRNQSINQSTLTESKCWLSPHPRHTWTWPPAWSAAWTLSSVLKRRAYCAPQSSSLPIPSWWDGR